MSKLEQIRTELSYRPGGGTCPSDDDVRLLLDYVEAAEAFRKAYFCDETFGCNTKEQNEAWYQARVALGLG